MSTTLPGPEIPRASRATRSWGLPDPVAESAPLDPLAEARVRRALYPSSPVGGPSDLGLALLRPGPPPSGSQRGGVALIVVLVLVIAGGLVLATLAAAGSRTAASPAVSATGPVGASAAPGSSGSTGPSVPDSPSAGTIDPTEALAAQASGDGADVESLAGSWVPQISSKRPGLVVDGQTYDAAAVLADHQDLRARYPDARLLRSAGFTTFTSPDFWVTVVAEPFSTSDGANAWCDAHGIATTQCYAKLLSHTASPRRASVLRSGS